MIGVVNAVVIYFQLKTNAPDRISLVARIHRCDAMWPAEIVNGLRSVAACIILL